MNAYKSINYIEIQNETQDLYLKGGGGVLVLLILN